MRHRILQNSLFCKSCSCIILTLSNWSDKSGLNHSFLTFLTGFVLCFLCLAAPILTESQAGMIEPPGTPSQESLAISATNTVEVTAPNLHHNESEMQEDTGLRGAWNQTIALKKGWNMVLGPAGDFYPKYLADPRRPTFSIATMYFSETEIDAAGRPRVGLRMGTRFGLLRFHKDGDPEHGFQLDLGAGFLGQFDMANSLDNIGWDGVYSLGIAWAPRDSFAIRVGSFHDSSHVGDEYAERTGRRRISYTREEALLGLSWAFTKKYRAYAEGAYAYTLRNRELMEPVRVQCGLEYMSPESFWKGRLGWYTAADVSSYEENDWDTNTTIQAGLLYPLRNLSRTWRLGIEYYDGRSHIGEFFQKREEYISIGFYVDL